VRIRSGHHSATPGEAIVSAIHHWADIACSRKARSSLGLRIRVARGLECGYQQIVAEL